MKERKEQDRKRKRFLRQMGGAAAVLVLLALLTGCSGERMETRREIERIKKAAESVAEDRAAAHILEKYGIEAAAEGYWVQAYNDFFAPNVNPNVVVFMEHGNRKFCVGIDVDDKSVLWDNYQREEIDWALQGYLRELYGLPPAYRAETVFRLEDAPNYSVATPAEWREKGYDHANMVDFRFEEQPAEELLARMEYLEFHDSWLSAEQSLETIAFGAEDWPICEGGYVEWNLRLYASPEAEFVDLSTGYPDIGGFPYFREWRRICLRDKGTEGQEVSDEFFAFQSLETEGITITSRFSDKIEDIIEISEGETQWETSQREDHIQAYRLVSDIFEVTENAADSYYATIIHVPEEFTAQYEGPLYILSRHMEEGHSTETGEVKVVKQILSQEELDALPADDSRRDYKIYANGTCGMSAGYQYAVAEEMGETETPLSELCTR